MCCHNIRTSESANSYSFCKLSFPGKDNEADSNIFDNILNTERCAVTKYHGISKKGRSPYNPLKKNQDALIMTKDPTTNTLILCVLDGHGEFGEVISNKIRCRLTDDMIKHPSWALDVKGASKDTISKIEDEILGEKRIDTDYSGTTLTMIIVRGNIVTGVNIGDSRAIMATDDNGLLIAENFTQEHKPDLPE